MGQFNNYENRFECLQYKCLPRKPVGRKKLLIFHWYNLLFLLCSDILAAIYWISDTWFNNRILYPPHHFIHFNFNQNNNNNSDRSPSVHLFCWKKKLALQVPTTSATTTSIEPNSLTMQTINPCSSGVNCEVENNSGTIQSDQFSLKVGNSKQTLIWFVCILLVVVGDC